MHELMQITNLHDRDEFSQLLEIRVYTFVRKYKRSAPDEFEKVK